MHEGEVDTHDPSMYRKNPAPGKPKRGNTTPITNNEDRRNERDVNYDKSRANTRGPRVDRHGSRGGSRKEKQRNEFPPDEKDEEDESLDEAAMASGGGGPPDDPDGSSGDEHDEGDSHGGSNSEEESALDDFSEEYRRKADELQRKYEEHKKRKVERRRRQQMRKQPAHRKHNGKKRDKKHPKHRRAERQKYTQDLYDTPVSDEGEEPDDQYYFAPEIFRASSARIYDPYDLKGIVAPQLNYGDDASRESFRVKYLDYVTKHKAKMRKRAPRQGPSVTSIRGRMHEAYTTGICV